ncbi:class I SAM-dependent methyltransferase [Micromonospora sp. NBC_01813]|uniref:class I SAM-dependent methyltransferase n=1 Tax=Micromonospora sp. NBC_01813 TaxID=2975988 RepID=UPI002DD9FD01|nr:methyltransferase domain-containing protein [Micromonospora sp. NBC_01813]WSA12078.1 class I SAM-dependent methyltransferase [Micromonospora sp. NBC_01813]
MSANPFLDPALVHGDLYRANDRLADRTRALREAKIAGRDAAEVIAALLARRTTPGAVVLDLGCGRGTSTLRIAARLRPRRLIAVDASIALLDTVRTRLHEADEVGSTVCANFHHLPLPDAVANAAVAAFCLYHSATPADAVAEIARCLRPGGVAVLVTKSLDSYAELDQLVHAAHLDSDAIRRPSLYESFHSGNLLDIAAAHLTVLDVLHEKHVFEFTDATHLARYLATTPKYQIRPDRGPAGLAAVLQERLPAPPYLTRSTVSYALAARS